MLRFHKGLVDLMVPIANLRPTEDNPNNGDVDEVVASMLRWGVYAPIIANEADGRIIAGHTRYAALMELGAKMAPVVWAQPATDMEHLGMLMGDNRIARLARMDEARELEAMRQLAESDKGLVGSGYDDRDIDRLAARLLKNEMDPIEVGLMGGSGKERLIHEIECPACHHTWVRGQGVDEE
jgi:ParB-like chromosome segregation protein Spo0J